MIRDAVGYGKTYKQLKILFIFVRIPKSRPTENFCAYIESVFMSGELKIISLTPVIAGCRLPQNRSSPVQGFNVT